MVERTATGVCDTCGEEFYDNEKHTCAKRGRPKADITRREVIKDLEEVMRLTMADAFRTMREHHVFVLTMQLAKDGDIFGAASLEDRWVDCINEARRLVNILQETLK